MAENRNAVGDALSLALPLASYEVASPVVTVVSSYVEAGIRAAAVVVVVGVPAAEHTILP